MKTKINAGKDKSPLESLFGAKIVPPKLALIGMKELEGMLAQNFLKKTKVRAEIGRFERVLRDAIVETVRESAIHRQKARMLHAAVNGMKGIDARLASSKLPIPRALVTAPRLHLGSIGGTQVPPYNYQWSWSAQHGGAAISEGANRTAGQMSFDLWNNSNDASASAAVAVGNYFRPPTDNGILMLWANPAFNYNWWTVCDAASAHSDAFIGFYVGRYNLSGGFDGAVIDQQISLWNDDSWASGGSDSGSNSGYPLFAQFEVDRSHWYAIWVWCGGNVSAQGWGGCTGSGAGAVLSVVVPSISWELF